MMKPIKPGRKIYPVKCAANLALWPLAMTNHAVNCAVAAIGRCASVPPRFVILLNGMRIAISVS